MRSKNISTTFLKSIFLFLLGIMIPSIIVQAYATTVTGSRYSFKVGSIGYHNYATFSVTTNDGYRNGYRSAAIGPDTGTSPAGYLGARTYEYEQLSDGSYSLITAVNLR